MAAVLQYMKNRIYAGRKWMKRKPFVIVAFCVLCMTGFAACYYATVDGSGRMVTQSRDVSDFNSISFSGGGKLVIMQGSEESLLIRTDDNLMEYIETDVRGSTLYIDIRRGYNLNPTGVIEYYIYVNELNSIEVSGSASIDSLSLYTESDFNVSISGSADIEIANLAAQNLDVDVSGSADIQLSGVVDTQRIYVSGSCSNNSPDLQSRIAIVDISGSSESTLWVTERLILDISGWGYFRYFGNPSTSVEISGDGDVVSMGSK
jgi:hypothetical protein